MNKHLVLLCAFSVFASPASASHRGNLEVPFDSRGECQAALQNLNVTDDFLLAARPDLFSSEGEVQSFLRRAFNCESNRGDGKWYIVDHGAEVLASEWFQRRLNR